jgi:hypothetical protein
MKPALTLDIGGVFSPLVEKQNLHCYAPVKWKGNGELGNGSVHKTLEG